MDLWPCVLDFLDDNISVSMKPIYWSPIKLCSIIYQPVNFEVMKDAQCGACFALSTKHISHVTFNTVDADKFHHFYYDFLLNKS